MYSADLGCWEFGKKVNLSSNNLKSAFAEACEMLETIIFSKLIQNPFVVQIYKNKRIVWDYTQAEP